MTTKVKESKDENWVKARIKHHLEETGFWYTAVSAGFFSVSGLPDFVACLVGVFVAIEAKDDAYEHRMRHLISHGKNKGRVKTSGGPRPEQRRCLSAIREARGVTLVIDRHNVDGPFRVFLDKVARYKNIQLLPSRVRMFAQQANVYYDIDVEE